MAVYVMSDLHGAYNSLLEMLQIIDFGPDDTLYILGDVVDRGENGIPILRFAMRTPNVKMLLGNHEYMMLLFFSPDATQRAIRHWNRNSNFFTLRGLDELTDGEKQELLEFVKGLPDEAHIEVNGEKFHLVHGFEGEDTYKRVWNRPKIDTMPQNTGEKLIIGHTPVCEYVCPGTDEEMYVYSSGLTKRGDHFRILHAPGFTDIDCCIGYGFSAARLACLRLDDGMEFYTKVDK